MIGAGGRCSCIIGSDAVALQGIISTSVKEAETTQHVLPLFLPALVQAE